MFPKLKKRLYLSLVILVSILLMATSAVPLDNKTQLVRKYTRSIEFDYTTWVWQAALRKNQQAAFGLADYLPVEMQHSLVTECVNLTRGIKQFDSALETIYSDPAETNPDLTAQPIKDKLADYNYVDAFVSPVCETILQQQVSELLTEYHLTAAGQPVPPVLFHATPAASSAHCLSP